MFPRTSSASDSRHTHPFPQHHGLSHGDADRPCLTDGETEVQCGESWTPARSVYPWQSPGPAHVIALRPAVLGLAGDVGKRPRGRLRPPGSGQDFSVSEPPGFRTHHGEEEEEGYSEVVTQLTREGLAGEAQGQPEVSRCPASLFISQWSPGTKLVTSTRPGRGKFCPRGWA